MTRVSVVVPCFKQAHFLPRALAALVSQSFDAWDAVIVDDGSPDGVAVAAQPWLADARVRYCVSAANRGLGAALNLGLDETSAPLVAYLPSDDVWYDDHLQTLVAALDASPDAGAAISGVRYHYNRRAKGQIPGEPIQLVQMLHRRSDARWIERDELTTDDLDRMYWSRLSKPVETGRVTCEWVDHPAQRHKIVREPIGGINP